MELEAAAAPLGFFARLGGIFAAPAGVFEDLKKRPTWVAPLLAITISIAGFNALVAFSDTGLEAMRQEFLAQLPPDTPPETVEQQLNIYRYFAPIGALISIPVITVLLAGLLYVVFSVVLGGEGTFRQTFSAYTHSGYIGLVGGAVGTALIFVKGNLKSSTALAAFTPFLEESSFAYKFLQMFDVFVLWQLAVLSIGLGIVQKTGTKKSATTIFTLFVIIALSIAGIRQAFS